MLQLIFCNILSRTAASHTQTLQDHREHGCCWMAALLAYRSTCTSRMGAQAREHPPSPHGRLWKSSPRDAC